MVWILRIWFKWKKKNNPSNPDSPLPFFFFVNILEKAELTTYSFPKSWNSDVHSLHLLPDYFPILHLQEWCHKQQYWPHLFYLSHLLDFMAFLCSSQEFFFYWPLRLPFPWSAAWSTGFSFLPFASLCLHFWLIVLPTLKPWAITSILSSPTLVWATDLNVKHSTRHLYFMCPGHVKFNIAKSERGVSPQFALPWLTDWNCFHSHWMTRNLSAIIPLLNSHIQGLKIRPAAHLPYLPLLCIALSVPGFYHSSEFCNSCLTCIPF